MLTIFIIYTFQFLFSLSSGTCFFHTFPFTNKFHNLLELVLFFQTEFLLCSPDWPQTLNSPASASEYCDYKHVTQSLAGK